MQQSGQVMECKGKKAVVRFKRSDACGKCDACFKLGGNEADIEIDNSLQAKEGDTVVIEMHARSVVKASLLLYGIPLVALITGAALGSLWSDIYAAIGGVLFAAGSFFILRGLETRLSRMSEFKPRMISIADAETDSITNEA